MNDSALEPFAWSIQPRDGDPRLGDLIQFARHRVLEPSLDAPTTKIVIVGFPSDQGVITNGGRPGAREGPDSIRRWLYRLTTDPRLGPSHAQFFKGVVDLGNLTCSGDVQADQHHLGSLLASCLQRNLVPIILGGGHETSFGHFLGYSTTNTPVAILNIDAHPDVRPRRDGLPHSGSPFRDALEHPSGSCRSYTVAGLSPHAVAIDHVDYLEDRNCRYWWNGEFTAGDVQTWLDQTPQPWLVTFDLDAVDAAYAPAVSAPNSAGMQPRLWLDLAELCGSCPHVRSMDIVELSPRLDRDDQTARLAALTVWRFLRGRVLHAGG